MTDKQRTITVRGTGKLNLKPDLIILSLSLGSTDKNYEKAVNKSAEALGKLKNALAGAGFDKDELKTSHFGIDTEYEGYTDKNGQYRNRFKGYRVTHSFKLEFDFDSRRLSDSIGAIASSVAEPELSIRFSVKDKDAAASALLENAAVNAKNKAEILAKASGVSLGELVSIDYNFSSLDPVSPTVYGMDRNCMKMSCAAESIDITPEDIDLTDSASFVWEIK